MIKHTDIYTYDSSSPSGLRFAKDMGYGRKEGDPVGTRAYQHKRVGPDGGPVPHAWVASMGGKKTYLHRIIYEMLVGPIPRGYVVDHIDGNPFNNNVNNLRAITPAMNMRNRRLFNKNKSGVAGVRRAVHNGYAQWLAQWYDVSGELRRKYFSILKFGEEEAFRKAVDTRATAIALLNSQNAGYSSRHLEGVN